ncbi:MAG: SDR family oxidoreductase [Candidatus Sericytochromatia bacterium]|nr:SDR family oxidoreductase [Candidatus Sericytochromatia bacterium]
MKALSGKTSLVTGASSGIGEAIARHLHAQGARVALAARRVDRLHALADSLGSEASVHPVDLSNADEAAALVPGVLDRWGRLDILVANAGVMPLAPVAEADMEAWRAMIDINLTSVITMAQASLAPMESAGGGDIVLVASVAGLVAAPTGAGYSATKAGLRAFGEALRRETARLGIRVTLISPGLVRTELQGLVPHDATREALERWASSMTPLSPDDVAEAVGWCVTRPPHVCIGEVVLRPTAQDR